MLVTFLLKERVLEIFIFFVELTNELEAYNPCFHQDQEGIPPYSASMTIFVLPLCLATNDKLRKNSTHLAWIEPTLATQVLQGLMIRMEDKLFRPQVIGLTTKGSH